MYYPSSQKYVLSFLLGVPYRTPDHCCLIELNRGNHYTDCSAAYEVNIREVQMTEEQHLHKGQDLECWWYIWDTGL